MGNIKNMSKKIILYIVSSLCILTACIGIASAKGNADLNAGIKQDKKITVVDRQKQHELDFIDHQIKRIQEQAKHLNEHNAKKHAQSKSVFKNTDTLITNLNILKTKIASDTTDADLNTDLKALQALIHPKK